MPILWYSLLLPVLYLLFLRLTLARPLASATPLPSLWISAGISVYAVALGLGLFLYWHWARKQYAEFRAASVLLSTLHALESQPARWRTNTDFRWSLIANLESIALAVENIPLAYLSGAPHVRGRAAELARAKADAVRELQLWVLRPEHFTYTDLAQRLANALRTIVDGRWYELPEAYAAPSPSNRILRFVVSSASVLVIASVLILVVLSPKLGPVVSVAVPILSVMSIALLNVAGLPVTVLGQYAEIGAKLSRSS